MTVAPALWKHTSRRLPPRRPAIAARSSSADSSRARIASACSTRTAPASVSRTPRDRRSTSCVPVSRSSAATCWLTADWVKLSASAAAENEPWAATSRKTFIRRTSSISTAYRRVKQVSLGLMGAICLAGSRCPARSVLLLLTLSAFWGASYLFIKVALDDDVAPWAIVSIRTRARRARAGAARGAPGVLGGLRGRFGPVVVLAFVQVAGPLTLIALGEERISSSLTGILVASAPIFTFLLAFASRASSAQRGEPRRRGDRDRRRRAAARRGRRRRGRALVGGMFVILAALGYAVAAWYLKRNLAGVEPVATVAGTQAVAALVTLPLGLLHVPRAVPGPRRGRVAADARRGLHRVRVRDLPLARRERRARAGLTGGLHRPGVLDLLRRRAARRELHGATVAGLALILGGSWLAAGRRAARTPPRCRGRG